MEETKQNIVGLEGEEVTIEVDALAEEKNDAQRYYKNLRTEHRRIEGQAPYPGVKPYSTVSAGDLDALHDLQYKKQAMQPYWAAMDVVKQYLLADALYSGHIRYTTGGDLYFTESLPTKDWRDKKGPFLINVDDKKLKAELDAWHYPDKSPAIAFSRNITMENRDVCAVDIVLDRSDSMYAHITDNYLRNALKRNKDKTGFQSIIQTIQQKQDDIRSLHKDKPFVVQGCAGSGKTMVLLHRLRYLIYNKDIYSEDYYFLVPSNGFKKYIRDITAKFNISYANVLSYQGYYRYLLGKTDATLADENSELVFSPDYLARVYSRQFMQEAYTGLFELIVEQTNNLSEFCDEKLNALVAIEEERAKDAIANIKANTVYSTQKLLGKIAQHLGLPLETYEQAERVIMDANDLVVEHKKRIGSSKVVDEDFRVSADDERVQADPKLLQLNADIADEEARTKKASIFTVNAHKKKLQQLTAIRDAYLGEVIARVTEEEKQIRARESAKLSIIFDDVTIQDAETAFNNALSIYENAQKHLEAEKEKQENITAVIEQQYTNEIMALTQMIEESANIESKITEWVSQLVPALDYLKGYLLKGTALFEAFIKYAADKKEQESIREKCKLFARRTDREQAAYLNTLLMNSCRKKIKAEFDIKICDAYKHFWYLSLYCNYLINGDTQKARPYIFIDEAQDLSPAEIELIQKLNNQPVVNLFGDINQVITTHGVRDWNEISGKLDVLKLDENFRNTNQIVDFCNRVLPFRMQKIGVDMENVEQYSSVDHALSKSKLPDGATIIVKDECAADDLKIVLKGTAIRDYKVYTVKEAKGLEFKHVIVIDRDMTPNEMYISYTRALAKLTVIHALPKLADPSTPRIIEGEDLESA